MVYKICVFETRKVLLIYIVVVGVPSAYNVLLFLNIIYGYWRLRALICDRNETETETEWGKV